MIVWIHLFIFIILTVLLILFPIISVTKKKGSSLIDNFQVNKKGNSVNLKKVGSRLLYCMNLFEYMFQNNFGVHFIWTLGVISWILGCCFWVIQADFASLIFISISIIFCLLAFFTMSDFKSNEYSDLKRAKIGFSVYFLIISISVVAMFTSKSFAVGITTNTLLLLFLFDWRVYKKNI